MTPNITLVVADDHPMLLKGLAEELKNGGYNILKTAANGIKALEAILDSNPNIAILDIEMPFLSGFEVISRSVEKNTETKFIILTSHKEKGFVAKAKKLRISGYILKDEPFSELDACIKTVAAGGSYFSTAFNEVYTKEVSPAIKMLQALSPSEKTILQLIANGESSKKIGETLNISQRTVEKHRTNIINKLDLPSVKNSLFAWAHKNKDLILSFDKK